MFQSSQCYSLLLSAALTLHGRLIDFAWETQGGFLLDASNSER